MYIIASFTAIVNSRGRHWQSFKSLRPQINKAIQPNGLIYLVGVKGLKPSASRSQTERAINCATPRYGVLEKL